MQAIFDFMASHWFLAWSVAWLGWGVITLLLAPLLLLQQVIRALVVCARGWPPEHLDVDGKFRPVGGDKVPAAE